FQLVQRRDLERPLREVDAHHLRALRRHRLGEDAAAAADVEHALALEPPGEPLDMAEAQRIDLVQRPEFARGVPPAMRERAEFGDFGGVDVHGTSIHDIRLCHQWALAAMSSTSSPVRRLSKTRGSPATQTWVTCSRPAA